MAPSGAATPLRLQPVSIGTETARIGATLWQAARGGGRLLLTRRDGRPLAHRAAQEARHRFAALGPTYVKLGQLIASSPGVFPETLSNEFRTLLDRVPPADPAAIRALLTEQLGAPPARLFARFDPEPIASASIAQVHRATLHSGAAVVVKIQRPGIKARLAADLQILERAAQLLELSEYGRMLGARDIVADFAANLNDEIDFHTESTAMLEWPRFIAGSPFADQVRVPRVYPELSTAKVLTMEYVEAIRIDDVAAVRAAGFTGAALLKTILLSLLESAFRAGLFHGDLHAGNVLVDAAGKVVFLDWGIVGRFDDRTRLLLRRLVVELMVHNDFEAAGRTIFEMGAVRRPGNLKRAARDIRSVTAPLQSSDLGALSYTQLGRRLAEVARIYQAKLPRELVLVGKQLLYVERYMKLLAPQWKPLEDPEVLGFMAGLLAKDEAASAPLRHDRGSSNELSG